MNGMKGFHTVRNSQGSQLMIDVQSIDNVG